MMIRRFFTDRRGAPAAEGVAKLGSRRDHLRRPALEALEGRDLLSLVNPVQRVSLNPQPTDNLNSDIARSSNGSSVVVWVNNYSNTDSDIWAQMLGGYGQPLGAPIQVDFTTAQSLTPRVAMDSQGRFAVTWENFNPDSTSDIMMRYFNTSGTPLTGITRVSSGFLDREPDVALSAGSMVVTWTHQAGDANSDIWAERFVISGGVPLAQGIFGVNTDTNIEMAPHVAMSPDGRFDIVYERHYSGPDWDIFGNQFTSTGGFFGATALVNFDGSPEFNPSISMDNAGNAVVAYERFNGSDYGIYANRLSSGGVVGNMITIRDSNLANETDPSVALAPTGGQFVVAYDTGTGVGVTEVQSGDTRLTTVPQIVGILPAIAIDGFGRYVVTHTRYDSPSGHADIFSQLGVLG